MRRGKSLSEYKMVAPFILGHETKEFYANGAAKKNRTQGNEFVHSMKRQARDDLYKLP